MAAYLEKAKKGDEEAQFKLGHCFEHGLEGVAPDPQAAVQWYRKAAEQGHVQAQYNIGSCLDRGFGIGKHEQAAVLWYRKAAVQGHAEAQFYLGLCLNNGVETQRLASPGFAKQQKKDLLSHKLGWRRFQ